jgi:hypothetical protein
LSRLDEKTFCMMDTLFICRLHFSEGINNIAMYRVSCCLSLVLWILMNLKELIFKNRNKSSGQSCKSLFCICSVHLFDVSLVTYKYEFIMFLITYRNISGDSGNLDVSTLFRVFFCIRRCCVYIA